MDECTSKLIASFLEENYEQFQRHILDNEIDPHFAEVVIEELNAINTDLSKLG